MFGASEVVALLISQARSDIADLMPNEPILQEARKNGLSRLVKKIKIKETVKLGKVGDEEGEGDEEEKVEETIIDRNIELEMYSSQEALKTLVRILGIDSQDELERGQGLWPGGRDHRARAARAGCDQSEG